MQINKDEFKRLINEKAEEDPGPLTIIMVIIWIIVVLAVSIPIVLLLIPIILVERYIKRKINARKINSTR